MKRLLPIILLLVFVSSCSNDVPILTYDNFDLNIDTLYDITSTSVSLRAKLTIHKYGNVPLSAIYVGIGRTPEPSSDNLYRELEFNKIDKVVTITIDSLTPNTLYYLKTGGKYNPPDTEDYKWQVHVRSFGFQSAYSFTTWPNYSTY